MSSANPLPIETSTVGIHRLTDDPADASWSSWRPYNGTNSRFSSP